MVGSMLPMSSKRKGRLEARTNTTTPHHQEDQRRQVVQRRKRHDPGFDPGVDWGAIRGLVGTVWIISALAATKVRSYPDRK